MPGSPQGSAAPTAPQYPPDALADLAVSILGALEGNHFDVPTALSSAPSSTCAVRAARGCCIARQLPEAPLSDENPFYFGKDAYGYILVCPRRQGLAWPRGRGGRCQPVRLTRWLVRAPPGEVVRHNCDNPACIRVSHLVSSTQAANLADAVRRGRRRGRLGGRSVPSPSPALRSVGPVPPTPAAAEDNAAQRAREARFSQTGFASPSKKARKAARARLQAASGGRRLADRPMAFNASASTPTCVPLQNSNTRPSIVDPDPHSGRSARLCIPSDCA